MKLKHSSRSCGKTLARTSGTTGPWTGPKD